ncbi:MAG: TrkA family potassium uptake protein [Actinobacteria bacterium]|nr:TrkA family potassium uptake protein [Actinomycetota bacterium]
MHVVVVGCGRVGAGLAHALEEAGHSVAVIDKQPRAFRRLHEGFKGKALVGVGFDRELLRQAGIDKAGALAAVTNGDNSNILVARVAKELFEVERVVARIYDPRRARIYERLGIPTIATAQWATERVLQRVLPDSPALEWIDPSAKVCLVERTMPAAWAGTPYSTLEDRGTARVVAVSRLGVAALPAPDLIAQDGDVVHVALSGDAVDDFDDRLGSGPSEDAHH